MLTGLWQRVLDLPVRTKVLGGGACALAVLLVVVGILTAGPTDDLGIADSGAGNEQLVDPTAAPGEQPVVGSTIDGVTVGHADASPSEMAPVAPRNAGESGSTAADRAIEDEMNATLPEVPTAATPDELAERAPDDVKFAGKVLERWSAAMLGCLRAGKAPLTCLGVAADAAPGVEYQNGELVGDIDRDVEFKIFRKAGDGVKVWLLYSRGEECHAYGDVWTKCSAW